ncbi:MAG: ester cyclase [Fibrobacteres bacterium]|nr:ester cyclase [Fibrobacterota bacterium]
MNQAISFLAVSAMAISLALAAKPVQPAQPAKASKTAAPKGGDSSHTPSTLASAPLMPSPGASSSGSSSAGSSSAVTPSNQAPPTGTAPSGTLGGSGDAQSSATRSMVDANKAAYRTVMEECMNRGNLAAADRIIVKDLVDHDPGNLVGGLDGFKKFVTAWRGAFPDSRVEVISLVGEGDRIMARTRVTGTHSGTFNGVAPTNKRFAVEGFDEVMFKNGMAVEHWGVSDQLGMMKQLGIMPNGTPQQQPSSSPAPAKPSAPPSNKY